MFRQHHPQSLSAKQLSQHHLCNLQLITEQQEETRTWDIPDSNSSGFSPLGFTIFALELNMAVLQGKRTSQVSPATWSSATNTAKTLQPGCWATRFREKPETASIGPTSPTMSLQGMPSTREKNRPGERGACPPTGEPGQLRGPGSTREAARALTEPHVRPSVRAGSPSRLAELRARPWPPPPARRLAAPTPRPTSGGGRRKTPPAPLPQHRAPRRPSSLKPAIIGGIPAPRPRRETPLSAQLHIEAAARGKVISAAGPRAGPGHPPLSAPA